MRATRFETRARRFWYLWLVTLAIFTTHAAAAAVWPPIAIGPPISGFAAPVHITNAGDGSGRLFVVEQGGTIRLLKNGVVQSTLFLDISGLVSCCGERGLLSVAFPPGYANLGHFYVYYTNTSGNIVLARYGLTSNPDVADASSAQIVLTINHPTFSNHNGGQLVFGPDDGYLYMGTGDGGGGGDPNGNGQNTNVLLGKLLRLDVESGGATYAVPATNPFVGRAGFRSEIWAYGLRNPWRLSFDRVTHDLYIGDVGQNLYEEVDFQPVASGGGQNYGWNIMEGFHCYNATTCNMTGLTLPVTEYTHSSGDCAVTGGFVYRGTQFPSLQGIYFYADYCTGRLRGLQFTPSGWQSKVLDVAGFPISSFGEDEAGEVYLTDYSGGAIAQLMAAPTTPAATATATRSRPSATATPTATRTATRRPTATPTATSSRTPTRTLGTPRPTATGGVPGPVNDACTGATVITSSPFNAVVATNSATTEPTDPSPVCGNHSRNKSVWFRYTASRSGTVSANTFGSNYDTVLAVYRGSCGALTPVACSTGVLFFGQQSRVTFNAVAGTTYYFMVTAALENGGTLRFQATF